MNLLTITDKLLNDCEHMQPDQFGLFIRGLCKDKMELSNPTLHQKFIEVYDKFIQQKIGVGAKIDGMQGSALKSIIAYITKESKNKTEAGILASWQYILDNWYKLDNFTRLKLQLSDINHSLINIMNQLKNGKPTTADAAQAIAEWKGE